MNIVSLLVIVAGLSVGIASGGFLIYLHNRTRVLTPRKPTGEYQRITSDDYREIERSRPRDQRWWESRVASLSPPLDASAEEDRSWRQTVFMLSDITRNWDRAVASNFDAELVQIVENYLPSITERLGSVPRDIRHAPGQRGRTLSDELVEQLNIVESRVAEIRRAIFDEDIRDTSLTSEILKARYGERHEG